MRIEFKNVLRIIDSIEKAAYYRGLPGKDFIKHQNIPLMLNAVISSLFQTNSFSYYLNTFSSKSEYVYLNITLARGILGKEEFRLVFPVISTNIFTLDLLKQDKIQNMNDMCIYSS
jgi:hypothetical protein